MAYKSPKDFSVYLFDGDSSKNVEKINKRESNNYDDDDDNQLQTNKQKKEKEKEPTT